MSDRVGTPGLLGLGIGLLAAGAAAGVATERLVMKRAHRWDRESDEPLGSIRGVPLDLVDSRGLRLHAETHEANRDNGDDLTLVFTHGYALNQDCWHYQRRDLQGLGRLVFWDQRSHGRSMRSDRERATLEQLGQDLALVVNKAAPEGGPVVLIGHSMGGMTVMELAAQKPEWFGDKVRGVALLGTSSGGLSEVPLGLPGAAAGPLHRVLPVAADILARNKVAVEFGRHQVNDLSWLLTRAYSFGSRPSARVTDFTHDMLARTPIDVIAEFLPTLQSHDQKAALEAFTRVETTVIVGGADRLTPPAHSEEIVRRVPGAEFEILPDTGHMLMLERYPEVNQGIRDLVARVRANLRAEGSESAGPVGDADPTE